MCWSALFKYVCLESENPLSLIVVDAGRPLSGPGVFSSSLEVGMWMVVSWVPQTQGTCHPVSDGLPTAASLMPVQCQVHRSSLPSLPQGPLGDHSGPELTVASPTVGSLVVTATKTRHRTPSSAPSYRLHFLPGLDFRLVWGCEKWFSSHPLSSSRWATNQINRDRIMGENVNFIFFIFLYGTFYILECSVRRQPVVFSW